MLRAGFQTARIGLLEAPPTMSVATPYPLDRERLELLDRLLDGLDPSSRWWLSGFIAGTITQLSRTAGAGVAPDASPTAQPGEPVLTIAYGTQTGNAARIAELLYAEVRGRALPARLLRLDRYSLKELAGESRLAVVISTQGDGDPPDDARTWVEQLLSRKAPRLARLEYAVLGLGDSSYPKFCAVGRRIDARLAELGATRLLPLAEADVDVDTVAEPWRRRILELLPPLPAGASVSAGPRIEAVGAGGGTRPTRDRPVAVELIARQRLTGRYSDREVVHLEFAIDPTQFDYCPGDAVGCWPEHDPALVADVLRVTGLDGAESVVHRGAERTLSTWLEAHCELTRPHLGFLEALAVRSGRPELATPEQRRALLEAPIALIDLLHDHPADWTAAELLAALRPLAPRLYSIASSRAVVGDELHLTVRHQVHPGPRNWRYGAASHYLCTRAEGEQLRLYLAPNERFRLPSDPGRDIIMIGPGTGVAPFRGFVQERAAIGAPGRNWLFFGNPRFREDFLYQLEWQQYLRDGRLHRLDLAFSRDGGRRCYVQDRMREQAERLWAWLSEGAYLYVCGDATRMAKGVHAALLEIAERRGGLDGDGAAEWIRALEAEGRYRRDVY